MKKHTTLNRYFRRAGFRSYHSNIFGNIKFLGNSDKETCEKLSKKGNILQFDNSATSKYSNKEKSVTGAMTTPTAIPEKNIKSVRVEDFFCDNLNSPWQPLPEHDLEKKALVILS